MIHPNVTGFLVKWLLPGNRLPYSRSLPNRGRRYDKVADAELLIFLVITPDPNAVVAPPHERMPVILPNATIIAGSTLIPLNRLSTCFGLTTQIR